MIMKYLIRHRKEQLLVDSLDGYKGCKILERNVSVPRVPHCKRVKGRWKVDRKAHERWARHAKFRAMTRGELMEFVEGRLTELEQRVAQLEAGVPQKPGEV